MQGLDLYNKVREVPQEAKKSILGGRLKGMTDINPMWRIKVLTEQFGPCVLGWYYEITNQQIVEGANEEKVAFVNISLYVKFDEEWSKPIQGTGGSSFISKEKSGLYTSDECFKMALTDAISVACKSLGVGADVYYEKDRTKYDNNGSNNNPSNSGKKCAINEAQLKRLYAIASSKGYDANSVKATVKKHYNCEPKDMNKQQYDSIVAGYEKSPEKKKE